MAMNIHRNARLTSTDGDAGQVVHVIVNPSTQEVTDLVVHGSGRLFTVPITAVEPSEDGTLSLRSGHSIAEVATPFAAGDYSPLDADTVREDSDWLATNGGAPLLNADTNAVHIGGVYQAPRAMYVEREAGGPEWRLQLKEERLIARAVPVEAGVVRIGRKVVERTETIEVPVREEWLIVELKAGGGRVSVDGRELQPGEVVEVPIYRERAVANKEVVISEDVTVRKDTVGHIEPVTATVRSERLSVDDPVGAVHQSAAVTGGHRSDGSGAPRENNDGAPSPSSGERDADRAEPGLAFEAARLRTAENAAVAGVVPTGPQVTDQTYRDLTEPSDEAEIVGLPLVTVDGEVLGTVGEVLGDRFRVNAPLARDYWLPRDLLSGSAPGGDLVVNLYREDLEAAKLEAPA